MQREEEKKQRKREKVKNDKREETCDKGNADTSKNYLENLQGISFMDSLSVSINNT